MTTIDFSSYQVPGVYVTENETPLVSIVAASQPTVVAIVGPSVGYRVNTESVVLSGTAPVQMAKLGIDPSSVVVSGTDGTIFSPSAYSLTVGGGDDNDVSTLADNTLTIARNGTDIPDGSTVLLSYHFTDTTYFTPQQFTNFEDVKSAFGEPLDTNTSQILSPVSLAAQFAFTNGARIVTVVATQGTATSVTRSQLQTGLDALGALDVDIVVPLPVGISGTSQAVGDVNNVGSDLALHCANASADGQYRVGIIGWEATSSVTPDTSAATIASERVMIAWPNSMNFYNGFANQTIVVSGYYLAAAYAGMMASFPVQTSLTKKTVRGFVGIPPAVLSSMTMTLKNLYSSSGVAVTERNRQGSLVVRHGVSTLVDNINHREMAIVRAKDAMVRSLYLTVDGSGLIGSPITPETNANVKAVMTGVLEAMKTAGTIVDYNALSIQQQSIDPTVIAVKFSYLPAYPLNYILITFSIDLQSGQTDVIDQTP